MDERTLRLLEYDTICAWAARQARTEMGRERCLALKPSADVQAVEEALEKTAEALRLTEEAKGLLPHVHDIRASLRRAERGGVLAPRELFQILETLQGLASSRTVLLAAIERAPRLAAMAERIRPESELCRELAEAVREDLVLDEASPELNRIRSEIRAVENRMRETLEAYVRDRGLGRYLQEPLVTQRNGRFVLPVKAEFRSQVPGLVHDVSSSGATLFIEPQAVVDLGNRLAELRHAEEKEVERILRYLSTLVGRRASDIAMSLEVAGEIDSHLARAGLGSEWRGSRPFLGGEELVIRSGRHPLLGARAVPLDLALEARTRCLVITGPNTGGKTVALKTVGLFALLAQSGFFLPADEGTRLPIFDAVFADIGDEQSITQNLSTFSSHMGAIAAILPQVTPQSLVLLDELGAGTDPSEGAALALAILEELLAYGARAIVTTHFGELKALAERDPRVQNASVAFDPESLRPTYRLIQGQAGLSHALAIAERLGLPASVLARARRHLGAERVRAAELLLWAERERERLERERRQQEAERRSWEERLAESRRRAEERERRAEEALEKARQEARGLVQEARSELRRLLQEARRRAAEGQEEQSWKALREAIRTWDERTTQPERQPEEPLLAVEPGETVEIVSLGQKGRVLEARGESVLVEVGMLRFEVPRTDLRRQPTEPTLERPKGTILPFQKALEVAPEIDLRGLTAEEAVAILDKYLDDAVLAGRQEVRIIHGKGTGVLRAAVQRHLAKHPSVDAFRLGRYGEGEDGVTIVTLKD